MSETRKAHLTRIWWFVLPIEKPLDFIEFNGPGWNEKLRFWQRITGGKTNEDAEQQDPGVCRSRFLGIVAREAHLEHEGESKDLKVEFTLEGILEFRRTSTMLELHSRKPEVKRKRPNYNGHKRRFLAKQINRVKYLICALKCVALTSIWFVEDFGKTTSCPKLLST